MRSRSTSRPLSRAMISIFVPPRSKPNRISQPRFAELGGDEAVRLVPVRGAKVRMFGRRQKRLQSLITDEMNARDVRCELCRRREMLRNIVDEERWATGSRRQRLHRLALQPVIGDDRKRQSEGGEIAQPCRGLSRRDVAEDDDVEPGREIQEAFPRAFDWIERIEFATKFLEQGSDFHIENRALVVLPFDVAVQAITGEIEKEALLLEKAVEACDEAQKHLVGIDDQ